MNNSINITLEPSEKGNVLTFQDLYDAMKEEMNAYKELNRLDELMKQEVSVHFNDNRGNVLYGFPTLFIGWGEGGGVHIAGDLEQVIDWEKLRGNRKKGRE
ncbi:hypothetical protein SFC65_19190 [Priestia filamentosa]|uniref:hypothetical protein n=1 Tax=Priestia filamentosa TaxID=1402861 RepID=UPI0039824061